jgi:hypothetical protein
MHIFQVSVCVCVRLWLISIFTSQTALSPPWDA